MTFQDHFNGAHQITLDEARAEVEALAAVDPRFRGVIKLLLEDWNAYAQAVMAQQLASDHGKLAHCGGSMHALTVLLAQFRRACTPAEEAAQIVPD
jgi:hypothetical protein